MRREAERPLLVGTVILVFLSIFTKRQASSPFEAMNSAHLAMCQKDVRHSVQKRWRTMAFSRACTGIRSCLHLVRWNMNLHLRHCRETGLVFSQGISGSIPVEAENTEYLSHTYFWGKAPLELLVESWLTSSVEDRESFSSWDDMGCTEHSSSWSTEINDPLYLRRLSQGISRGS